MTLVRTGNKSEATRAFINQWLKDNTKYCNNCGRDLDVEDFPCCYNPQLGTNFDHCGMLMKQNDDYRKDLIKDTGGNKDNSMRRSVAIPPRLFEALERYYKKHGEQLFNNVKELQEFMRDFPQFCTVRKI